MTMSFFKRKRNIIHADNGGTWAFESDSYVGHFRDGVSISLLLRGVQQAIVIRSKTEEDAISLGIRLTSIISE